jgi:hypothetical protein
MIANRGCGLDVVKVCGSGGSGCGGGDVDVDGGVVVGLEGFRAAVVVL